MGRIFMLMGKSASGKDSLRKKILGDMPGLGTYIPYTTRPRREGEIEGDEYHFVSGDEIKAYEREGRLIEQRVYNTVCGPWVYATVDDGQLSPDSSDILMEGTLEAYTALREYFGRDRVIPLYIEVDDGERLIRAVTRERSEDVPRYAEVARRFLADSADFSEENLAAAGIDQRYVNDNIAACSARIEEVIGSYAGI